MRSITTIKWAAAVAASFIALTHTSAFASLAVNQSYVGKYAVSTSGWGSTTQAGTITATVPVGATVTQAFLYTSTYSASAWDPVAISGTLNGTAVTYTPLGAHPSEMQAGRADVTAIVAPIINGGPGGTYNFTITETDARQDGSALVVVYSLNSLPVSTVAIMDGFSDSLGDSATLNFATPLNPAAPAFFAEMRLGIGFSCCGQRSSVTVNGTLISENAGNNDDSADADLNNGNLITVGGSNDPFSPLLPDYDSDHERYNLVPYVTAGASSIQIATSNPSGDDNIFLAVFHAFGVAGVNEPPVVPTVLVPVPTMSAWMLALVSLTLGLLGMFVTRKHVH